MKFRKKGCTARGLLMAKVSKLKNRVRNRYDRESRILIIDDDDTLLKFFKIHLNKFFSKVSVTANSREAFDLFKNGSFDLVLTDVNMPRFNGFQLMKRLKKHDDSVPVIIVTGISLSPEQEKDVELADGFLRKPFSMDELHLALRNALQLRKQNRKELEEIPPQLVRTKPAA